jgi:hypothetical protein
MMIRDASVDRDNQLSPLRFQFLGRTRYERLMFRTGKRKTALLYPRFDQRTGGNKISWMVFLRLTGVLSGARFLATRGGFCVITIKTKLEPKDKFSGT